MLWRYGSAVQNIVDPIQVKPVAGSEVWMVSRTFSKITRILHSQDSFEKILLGSTGKRGCVSLGYMVCFYLMDQENPTTVIWLL